jgi:GrpB-like predicted nucleotidyltransferase (UPF0157 family)
MAEFLVEMYVARDDPMTARRQAERSDSAATALSLDDCVVRCVRSIYVPEDETCFLLFEAPTVEAVRSVMADAGLRFEHISTASSPGLRPLGGV